MVSGIFIFTKMILMVFDNLNVYTEKPHYTQICIPPPIVFTALTVASQISFKTALLLATAGPAAPAKLSFLHNAAI
jgi:hypothetical protein